MYTTPEALDKTLHSSLRYTPQTTFGYAANIASVPLLATEADRAAQHYPLLFTETGDPSLLAVLGLKDKNVYLDAQLRWTVDYIPAFLRRYPFILANNTNDPDNHSKFYLAIDRSAPHFVSPDGEPLLTDSGELGEPSTRAMQFLKAFQENLMLTQAALRDLDDSGALVSKTLTIQDAGTTRLIGGFRVVEAEKLYALPDATLAAWTRSGMLQMIFAHWRSLSNLNAVAIASGRAEVPQ